MHVDWSLYNLVVLQLTQNSSHSGCVNTHSNASCTLLVRSTNKSTYASRKASVRMKPALLFSTTCESKQNINELSFAKNQSQYLAVVWKGKLPICYTTISGRRKVQICFPFFLNKCHKVTNNITESVSHQVVLAAN